MLEAVDPVGAIGHTRQVAERRAVEKSLHGDENLGLIHVRDAFPGCDVLALDGLWDGNAVVLADIDGF